MNEGNGIYEQVVALTFILLRLLIVAGLVWYAVFEYRRWSRKSERIEDFESEEDNQQ